MDIMFCTKRCPISPNVECRLNAIQEAPVFYTKNNLNRIVQDISTKIYKSPLTTFILKLKNFKCLDNGFSASYDIYINNDIIAIVTFSHPEICIPYCCIYFLNHLKTAIEMYGFSSKTEEILNPCSEILFNKTT